jgi:RsiW-degrading membrane proteinase PrsW (M82 family)
VLRAIPLTLTLLWLCIDSPRMFAAESQFALQVLAVTLFTRTIPLRTALTAFSMGVGIVAPLVTLTGTALASIGVDVDNHAGNWLVVPLIEETLKLLPVGWLAWRHVRTTGLPFNGSDWLAVAAMGGAGFAMVENAYLSHHDLVYRYGPALGPFYLFPTAWGYAGYLGHGAGTAFAGLGAGLSIAASRAGARGRWLRIPAGAMFAWITLEHGLANMFYNERWEVALALGAGRVTPALFLAALFLVLAADAVAARATLRHSPKLQRVLTLLVAGLRSHIGAPAAAIRDVPRLVAAVRLLNRVAAMPAGSPPVPSAITPPEVRT